MHRIAERAEHAHARCVGAHHSRSSASSPPSSYDRLLGRQRELEALVADRNVVAGLHAGMAQRVDHAEAAELDRERAHALGRGEIELVDERDDLAAGDAHDAVVPHEPEDALARARAVEQVVGQLLLARAARRLGDAARSASTRSSAPRRLGDAGARRAGEAEHVRDRVLVARDDGVRRQPALRRRRRRTRCTSASPSAVVDEVELVEHDDLRSLGEAAAMGRQLAVDRGVALAAVGERIAGLGIDRDHVHERVRALEVRQERVPEPDAVGRALEQPGHVGHGQLARVVQLDRAEMRSERRERVVRDLGHRIRDASQERRLAGIREAEQRGIADHLEPQLELGRLAVLADLGRARRLAHGVVKRRLPRPPRPPRAITTRALACARSAIGTSPLESKTCVPSGTWTIASSPRPPVLPPPSPCTPRWPRRCRRKRNAERSRMSGSASSTTSPPSPPSPPSGPPFGTNFSRRKETQPSPPRPACTTTVARS